jgi:calcineurin-like phosphoesterase family protein
MGEVFFTADWHFGHQRISELAERPFASVEEMNEEMVRRHNEWVNPSDTVWVLGDVAMGPIAESLALCKRMNGRKHLISGNHDRTWTGYPHSGAHTLESWQRRYVDEGGFDAIITGSGFARSGAVVQVPLGFGGEPVQLWHFPRTGDSQADDRYAQWRPRPWRTRGKPAPWLLHGHVHQAWQVRPEVREINVGVDVWDFEPVHVSRIIELIDDGPQ